MLTLNRQISKVFRCWKCCMSSFDCIFRLLVSADQPHVCDGSSGHGLNLPMEIFQAAACCSGWLLATCTSEVERQLLDISCVLTRQPSMPPDAQPQWAAPEPSKILGVQAQAAHVEAMAACLRGEQWHLALALFAQMRRDLTKNCPQKLARGFVRSAIAAVADAQIAKARYWRGRSSMASMASYAEALVSLQQVPSGGFAVGF